MKTFEQLIEPPVVLEIILNTNTVNPRRTVGQYVSQRKPLQPQTVLLLPVKSGYLTRCSRKTNKAT